MWLVRSVCQATASKLRASRRLLPPPGRDKDPHTLHTVPPRRFRLEFLVRHVASPQSDRFRIATDEQDRPLRETPTRRPPCRQRAEVSAAAREPVARRLSPAAARTTTPATAPATPATVTEEPAASVVAVAAPPSRGARRREALPPAPVRSSRSEVRRRRARPPAPTTRRRNPMAFSLPRPPAYHGHSVTTQYVDSPLSLSIEEKN